MSLSSLGTPQNVRFGEPALHCIYRNVVLYVNGYANVMLIKLQYHSGIMLHNANTLINVIILMLCNIILLI